MEHEEFSFEKLFTERLKQKSITIKKLSEVTGISRSYIENIASGNYREIPSAPYLRGYLMRLGKILDIDGEEWWEAISKESTLKKSGAKDTLPKNRFTQKYPTKFIWMGIVGVIVLIFFIMQFARISGKPTITLAFPSENPYTASSAEISIQGTITNADSLSINGDSVSIEPNGSWQKDVLLQDGFNTLSISGKKFLGGESQIVEQIIYEPSPQTTSSTKIIPETAPTGTSGANSSGSLPL